jgi:hypothetical protein
MIMSKTTYTVMRIAARDLEVDRRVQRDDLNQRKVEAIEHGFNEDALGVIIVSARKDRGLYIIDGWHRTEATKRKDPAYELTCHVFEDLTLVQEAEMFLDYNFSDKPSLLEKYKVRLAAEDPDSLLIEQMTTTRGWKVDPNPAPGHIQAIGALYRINELSKRIEAEPHLLDATLMVLTRAWGNNREAAQAVILEGLARVIARYAGRVDLNRLYEVLRNRGGGVEALHDEASQMAKMERSRVTNMVAHLIVVTYNKHARSRALPAWGQRT